MNALQALHEEWKNCTRCPLCEHRMQVVLGYGNPHAKLFVISDKPGKVEDETGIPMTGPAGETYKDMLQAFNLTSDDVWTTNCVCCIPPENRDPYTPEMEACKERLYQELFLVDPYVILVMGRVTKEFLLGDNQAISKCQGKTYLLTLPGIVPIQHSAITTYNPAWVRKYPSLGRGEPRHQMTKAFYLAIEAIKEMEESYGRSAGGTP